jgi:hypothetical protein
MRTTILSGCVVASMHLLDDRQSIKIKLALRYLLNKAVDRNARVGSTI